MKVLVLCDQFPPGFGPRMGYLCKYLAKMGIETHVVSEWHPDTRFEVLCGYATEVETVRYYKYENGFKYHIEWFFTMLLNVILQYKDRRMVRRLKARPDMRGYDLILCSTYKTFPLKAAEILSRRFGIPYIADLRDIAEQFPSKSYMNRRLGGGRLGVLIDRCVTAQMIRRRNTLIRKAAYTVSVSPWHVDFLKRITPNIKLIYNGYDPELFSPEPVPDAVFRISFTGKMMGLEMRDPRLLLEAVGNLYRRGEIKPEDVYLEWFVEEQGRAVLEEQAVVYRVEPFMHYEGFVPLADVPKVLNRSSILLQLANKAGDKGPHGIMTTKIFEALAVQKPILLVRSDESYLEELVNRYGCGLAARQVVEVEDFIMEQYRIFKSCGRTSVAYTPDQWQEIASLYSRRGQARQFAGLFDDVLKKRVES